MDRSTAADLARRSVLERPGEGKRAIEFRKRDIIFAQGDPADAVFYTRGGKITLTTTSYQGKEAVVAIVSAGGFIGEGCLAGQVLRKATAAAMTDSSCIRVEKAAMIQLLHQRGEFSGQFA